MRNSFGAATPLRVLCYTPNITLAQSEVVVWVAGAPR